MILPLKINSCTTTNLDVDAKSCGLVFVIWVTNKVFEFVLLGWIVQFGASVLDGREGEEVQLLWLE